MTYLNLAALNQMREGTILHPLTFSSLSQYSMAMDKGKNNFYATLREIGYRKKGDELQGLYYA
ncbi:MAG TPA: hypothetical protein DCE56_10975 [Cyanobacteria bacterium UBA8553]|nr:hypothetical protein [Cyanobacteria bacterium UBA8553]HAJ62591.1 hypothetical protein [Cyanobacteria bacterium UBA8543]